MKKISVIIPAWNAEKYLKEAVESALNQTYGGEIEIVVVDNGSTDGTLCIAEALSQAYPCVRVFTKPYGWAGSARNLGLERAVGDLILFHDADDVLEKDALATLYAEMKRTGAACVTALARDFKSPELLEAGETSAPQPPYGGALTGCALFTREAALAVGGFDEALSSGETVDWMLRFRDLHLQEACVDVVTKNRRVHKTNTTRTFDVNYADALRKRIKERMSSCRGQRSGADGHERKL